MISSDLSPGLLLIVGALLLPFLPRLLRNIWLCALPVLAFVQMLGLERGQHGRFVLFDLELTTLRVDELSLVFGYVFSLGLLIGAIYQLHLRGWMEQTAGVIYAGSAVGAVFAGDLVSLFLFWEGTSIASVFLIWASRTEAALAAGMRYLIMQVGSGVILLAGAMVHYGETGSLAFDSFDAGTTAGLLILISFGIKAAFPLLHGWLKDAYPEATVTGTVILSVFTTKLAIYALIRGFAGTEILVPIGAAMAALPIFWALIESDYRRVLAWGLNSQLGFMVVGVGIGTDLAINGAVAHAVASVIYQALLFMAMGAVLFRTGTARGAELGGLARQMPWTVAFYGIGVASIAAFPLFSGFVSKSMILSAAGYKEMFLPWLVLLFSGAATFVYAGLRIPFSAFFGAPRHALEGPEAPRNMLVAMGIAAALSVGIGILPGPLYDLLPRDYEYHPWTGEHVLTQLQLLALAAFAFVVLWRLGVFPRDVRATHLDADWLWRRVIGRLAMALVKVGLALWGGVTHGTRVLAADIGRLLSAQHGPTGALARTRPSGSMAFWMTVMLLAFLIFSFV